MCGLAGFARHPEAPDLELAKGTFRALLSAIRHRGHHSTGVAITGGVPTPYIWKRAVPVEAAIRSDAWTAEVMDRITGADRVVQGHVRFGTHGPENAANDAAAHPFTHGSITGAHNGIIRNWREIEAKYRAPDEAPWLNDSQAAFAALSSFKDPAAALDELDGYWALTWAKGKRLFLCRTAEAPLACAYVAEMRTLFWCSERPILERVLRERRLGAFEAWEVSSGTVYAYDPGNFTAKGTNAIKGPAPFRGKVTQGRGRIDTARPSMDQLRAERDGNEGRIYSGGSRWDAAAGREVFPPAAGLATDAPVVIARSSALEYTRKVLERTGGTIGREPVYTLREMNERIAELTNIVAGLCGDIDVLKAENDHLYTVLNDAGILSEPEETREPSGTPFRPEPPAATTTAGEAATCQECGEPAWHGDPLYQVKGDYSLHGRCMVLSQPAKPERPAVVAPLDPRQLPLVTRAGEPVM